MSVVRLRSYETGTKERERIARALFGDTVCGYDDAHNDRGEFRERVELFREWIEDQEEAYREQKEQEGADDPGSSWNSRAEMVRKFLRG